MAAKSISDRFLSYMGEGFSVAVGFAPEKALHAGWRFGVRFCISLISLLPDDASRVEVLPHKAQCQAAALPHFAKSGRR